MPSNNNLNEKTVSFNEALKVWIQVAIYSFGGPAGQISVMHKLLVEEKKWISESRFMHALNFCMLLPGPEAQQLAVYNGWILHGFKGGLTAGTLFVLPGFISILILSILYALYNETAFIKALFFGLKAAVLAIVLEAVIRIGKKALKNFVMYFIAASAFISIFFFNVPFPIIILASGIIGLIGGQINKNKFIASRSDELSDEQYDERYNKSPSISYLLKVFIVFVSLWMLPVVLLLLFKGKDNVLTEQALFFSKTAVLTFGGAYAILAYISQQAVQSYGWLKPAEMLDGLGMAETTPGPLIQVVQFVAFMGAFRLASEYNPVISGIAASVITAWVTFVPSFLWIFLGAPYVERIRKVKWLNTVLSSITAAVAGVILNLALWFFIHTVFGSVSKINFYSAQIYLPDFFTINWVSLLISVLSFIALFIYKVSMLKTLFISMLLGFVYSYVFS